MNYDKISALSLDEVLEETEKAVTLKEIVMDHIRELFMEVGRRSETPPEMLAALAGCEDEGVRQCVASNLNTPREVLKRYAKDENGTIRFLVAENRSTPVEALKWLAKDEERSIRFSVYENPSTPKKVAKSISWN